MPHFDFGHLDGGHVDEGHLDHHLDFHHTDVHHGDEHFDHEDHSYYDDHHDHSDEHDDSFVDEGNGDDLPDPWLVLETQQRLLVRLEKLEELMERILKHLRLQSTGDDPGR